MEKINSLIWNRRNTHVKDWERALSITKNKKRFYRRQHSNTVDAPPVQDNFTDPQPRRVYTHRRIVSSPYSREGGFYNDRAHIKKSHTRYST
ncbi:hypothetical protein RhiirA1_535305 [Rhizophagus irregularis]|uniref:Uncharacterized protein n=2 Tax=Rhizophagus irregularis TaxID=588596 RepID=A0A2N0RU82_9GLOM|nr:hypothetical protein RhiirA1_535305 [Rhizophagus irregularis]CAB4482602.1 unnamed protein product [Rhizophagus irregularis]